MAYFLVIKFVLLLLGKKKSTSVHSYNYFQIITILLLAVII